MLGGIAVASSKRRRMLQAGRAGGALLAMGLTGCAALPQSTIDVAGPVARRQLELLNFTTWLMVVIGVLVALAVVYVMLRFRDRGQPGRPPQTRGHRGLQIAWTVIPILIVIYKAVPTVADAFYLAETPPNAMQVNVIGHQWWWEFQYPDLGITTANELHIPVGQPVDLRVSSVDVIHSFWVPRLAGKVDAIPGRSNKLWLQADQAEIFWGQCAELCGTAHAHMAFRVVAQPPDAYAAWTRRMQDLAAHPVTPADPVAARGQELFTGKAGCLGCHTIAGTRAAGKVGPNLTGLALRTTIGAAALDNTAENLSRWIHHPAEVKPGALMPKLPLTDAEIQQLVAYLRLQK